MAEKKTAGKGVAEIKKLLGTKKLLLGTSTTIKNLKRGETKKVYLSSNCPSSVKEDITHYGKIGNAEIVQLTQANDEIGSICKKTFSISVIGILK